MDTARKDYAHRPWDLPDSAATPEPYYLRRREFLRVFGLGVAASAFLPLTSQAASTGFPDALNAGYKLDGVKITPEDLVTSYNNFYEWGLAKDQPKELANRGWKTRPWSIEISGLCANPRKMDVDQNGAPIRVVIPWKYGFKSARWLAKIEFLAEQPKTLWNQLAPNEYGFYANVNPNVDHPRWSQKSERVIGAGFFSGKQATLMFNGYEKQVGHLYAGMDLRKNF